MRGSNTSGSSRLDARTKTAPGIAELVEYTADPQLGQNPRLTVLPASEGLSKNLSSPVWVNPSPGTIMCEQWLVPLDFRQSTQKQCPPPLCALAE